MEDCKNTKINLDIILIDLEKAHDRIPKDINWPYGETELHLIILKA